MQFLGCLGVVEELGCGTEDAKLVQCESNHRLTHKAFFMVNITYFELL